MGNLLFSLILTNAIWWIVVPFAESADDQSGTPTDIFNPVFIFSVILIIGRFVFLIAQVVVVVVVFIYQSIKYQAKRLRSESLAEYG